jgi:hypothetical protein
MEYGMKKEKKKINSQVPRKIEIWPVSKLKEHPENKRLFNSLEDASYERLKSDIKKNGIHDALIVTEKEKSGMRTVLAGYNRFKAARELGLKRVPVLVKMFNSKEEEKHFIIRDNLHRRQLKPKQIKTLIKELYGKDVIKDNRGGNRGNQFTGGRMPKVQSEPLAKKAARELGITEGTAKRHLAEIRNPKGKTAQHKTINISNSTKADIAGEIIKSINIALDKYQIGCIADQKREEMEVKAFGLLVENYLSRLNYDNKHKAIKEASRIISKFVTRI